MSSYSVPRMDWYSPMVIYIYLVTAGMIVFAAYAIYLITSATPSEKMQFINAAIPDGLFVLFGVLVVGLVIAPIQVWFYEQ